jgi:hypothetical protein
VDKKYADDIVFVQAKCGGFHLHAKSGYFKSKHSQQKTAAIGPI